MKVSGVLLILSALILPPGAAAQRSREPPTQEEIITFLRSEEISVISEGISGASRTPHQEWTPELREAILYALEMEMWRDAEAARLGVHRFSDENLASSLADLAVVMQDPAAIPLLVQHTGSQVVRAALIVFGREALPELIRTVKEGDRRDATTGVITLRQMVQGRGLNYFTKKERAELKELVIEILRPDPSTTWGAEFGIITLAWAAHLALTLEDVEARSWVQFLAMSKEAFHARTGSQYSDHYRQFVREALHGDRMMPKFISLNYYFESWREQERNGLGRPR